MYEILIIIFVIIVLYLLLKPRKHRIGSKAIHIASVGKNLYLSTHAMQRLKERGVEIRKLKEMLESKNSKAIMQPNGRIKITNGKITAVLALNANDLVLVTVFKNVKSRSR